MDLRVSEDKGHGQFLFWGSRLSRGIECSLMLGTSQVNLKLPQFVGAASSKKV